MSSPTTTTYSADHPHSHRHNHPSPSSSPTHRGSMSSHLTTLTHAPNVFLGSLHRHEREMVINHQQRIAKKEANAAIEKYEASFSSPQSSSSEESSTRKGSTAAARAAMGAGASEEDEREWEAIVAARAAATKRSATLDLEKEMADERQRQVLAEIEEETRGQFS